MNKSELVEKISENTGMTKSDVDTALSGFFEVVSAHVASSSEKITIPGFLSIEQVQRAGRMGRNPRTGEPIEIAAKKSVKVTAGSTLKKAAEG
ncbi:MAG: HU family DNA-binding protein [Actinomycetota bacterium]